MAKKKTFTEKHPIFALMMLPVYLLSIIAYIVLISIVTVLGLVFKPKQKPVKINAASLAKIGQIDDMDGHDFEYWCANLLRRLGYEDVHVTSGSGDQGVDIIAVKDGNRWAFQCKRYSSNVGNAAVQQVYAGMRVYQCQIGAVITNQHFTESAKTLANKTNIQLWDRRKLIALMQEGGCEEKNQGADEPKKGIIQRVKEFKIRMLWKERKPQMTLEEIQRYKKLPHVDFEEGMNEEERLYFESEVVDPWILGDDYILSLVSNEFEDFHHAEHLSKAVEKHFYAETEVKISEHSKHYVHVKVRVRNIRANFKEDCFIVANWA